MDLAIALDEALFGGVKDTVTDLRAGHRQVSYPVRRGQSPSVNVLNVGYSLVKVQSRIVTENSGYPHVRAER